MGKEQYGRMKIGGSAEIEMELWFPDGTWGKERDMEFYREIAIIPEQTHSVNVAIVEENFKKIDDECSAWKGDLRFPETDALITFRKGVRIGVVTADCVPIVLYAPDVKGIAAVHAGWKGTLNGILDRTVDMLSSRGADTGKIIAVFGPSISQSRYEVDEELADRFVKVDFGEYISKGLGDNIFKPHIDLQGVNRERLLRKGLKPDNIHLSSLCTYSSLTPSGTPMLQSYRRDGITSGRNLTTICMR